MAISSYKTYLMTGTGSPVTYSKLIDIKSTPDGLMGQKNLLETTTLSDGQQTFIDGIRQVDSAGFQFTANYTKSDFSTLNGSPYKDADLPYAVWFGTDSVGSPDGSDGKFSFKGVLSVSPNGVGVDEVVEMTITIAPSTEVTFA